MKTIRACRPDESASILAIINAAAERYRDAIPADCWREPYMSAEELEHELSTGVTFWGYEVHHELIGVMGVQTVRDVDLIRHAYVHPRKQRHGVGSALINHLQASSTRPMLVGTWADATWAIRFYQHHGFDLVPARDTPALLRSYWNISDRQIETSVVLRDARPA